MATGLSIEKLKGRDNFHDWKFAVKKYLIHEDLWDLVNGAVDAESTAENKKKSLKANAKIVLLLDPVVYASMYVIQQLLKKLGIS